MKKAFLIILFICGFTQAQDFEYLESLKSIETIDQAEKLAKDIASYSKNKMRLYKQKDFSDRGIYVFKFVPADLTDDQVSEMDNIDKEFIQVRFLYFNVGENKDLEIKGKKTFKLSEVQTKYLNLFPYWQKYFKPEANLERTIEDHKSQRLAQNGIEAYISKRDDIWTLRMN